jgi:hypothetical protein
MLQTVDDNISVDGSFRGILTERVQVREILMT